MKIAVIGMVRSRSSILLEAISLFYKIPILQENLNQNQNLDSFLLNTYNQEKGVIRFHPEDPTLYKKTSYKYFELFNFEQYDKIFFTTRDSVTDYICSYSLALQLNRFTYQSVKDFEIDKPVNHFSIYNNFHFKALKHYVFSQLVIDEIKKYFIKQGISSKTIEYNDIPSFIKNNYLEIELFHLETKYNYKNIFSNYSDIENIYLSIKPELIKKCSDDNM